MKTTKIIVMWLFIFLTVFIAGCKEKKADGTEKANVEEKKETGENPPAEISQSEAGYALGVMLAENVKELSLKVDIKDIKKGFEEAMSDNFDAAGFTDAQMILSQVYYQAHIAKTKKTLEEGKKFLEENKKKQGIIVTDSGLQYEILKEGDSDIKPVASDTVEVNYKGTFIDGTVFDDSSKAESTVKINLSRVIPAWTEGVPLMTVGSKYKFYIPSELAYGEQGFRAGNRTLIPENSVLIFEIELISIVPTEK